MARSDGQVPRTVGRYILYGELAAGGMATVHFGRLSGPVGFSRTVAIKRLHPQFAKDPDFVTMFLDEARLCGRIRHPNVVPTLDVVATDDEIFIVMEYVAGESLAKLLRTAWQKNLHPSPRVVATILSSVLHGLHAAHQTKDEQGRDLGIVHRDVSPQNILVGADGSARVLDFGVAKAAGRAQTTRDGQIKGKIAYMPPEQLSSGEVTPQTDIYAAAVVMWEALAGRRLFDGETEALVLLRAIEGKSDPPSRFRPGLPQSIDNVVMRGLARDPSKRYTSAREMALAIEQTIGFASPSEVGAWVESIAATELGRRAAKIAEIESSAVNLPVTPLSEELGVPPHSQVSGMHSQVSSLHAQVSTVGSLSEIRPPGGFAKKFAAACAVLGVLGAGLAAFTLYGPTKDAQARDVRTIDHQVRSFARVAPSIATSRASAAAQAAATPPPVTNHSSTNHAVTSHPQDPQPSTTRPVTAPPSTTPKRSCDPPYTVDPVTGHKKYKPECF